jgi:SAM-dependent methyltransferase
MGWVVRRDSPAGSRVVNGRSPIETLRHVLQEPELAGIEPDSEAFTDAHRRILNRKRLVQDLFAGFYRRCRDADEFYFGGASGGRRLELGSGAGLLKSLYPDVLTSDVKHLAYVDLVARGEELPFPDASLRAIYAMNVFHHVSDPRVFFSEIERVVAPGGGIIMVEPYYGPLARLIFKRLFTQESYDTQAADWPRHGRQQVASDANQALSYIVLKRDAERWQAEFPGLELVADDPHTHMGYLLSGGVNFRQLVPNPLGKVVLRLEERLSVLNPLLALQHTLVVRRRRE